MLLPSEIRNRRGERLDVSFHPATGEGSLLILGHGVTGNKDRPLLVALAEGLAARGWPCLRLSFSGNGNSEGAFGEATIRKEVEDLRDLLGQLPEGLKLAYAGHSMGGAVGLMTAGGDARLRVLVTLAGMVRTADFCAREFGEEVPDEGCMWEDPDCPLSRDFVEEMEVIGDLFSEVDRLKIPFLLVHGTADDVVPIEDSRDAHSAAKVPKQLLEIEGAGHSFDDSSYEVIVTALAEWLERYLG